MPRSVKLMSEETCREVQKSGDWEIHHLTGFSGLMVVHQADLVHAGPLLLLLMKTFFLGWGRDNRALPSRDMGKWAGQENSSGELKQWPAVPQEEQLWGLGIWMSLSSFFSILTTFACFFCFSQYLWVLPQDLVFVWSFWWWRTEKKAGSSFVESERSQMTVWMASGTSGADNVTSIYGLQSCRASMCCFIFISLRPASAEILLLASKIIQSTIQK